MTGKQCFYYFGVLMKHILFLLLILSTSHVSAQSLETGYDTSSLTTAGNWREPQWSAWLATQMKLNPEDVCEVRTYDGSRVDILTDNYAIEVEWAKKWKESVGQATLYSVQTRRAPAVILLSRGNNMKYIHRCQIVCTKLNIVMIVQRVPERQVEFEIDP